MTKGGKREGSGRVSKYFEDTVGKSISWPPAAIREAKQDAKANGMSLSEHLLIKVFGRKFHK